MDFSCTRTLDLYGVRQTVHSDTHSPGSAIAYIDQAKTPSPLRKPPCPPSWCVHFWTVVVRVDIIRCLIRVGLEGRKGFKFLLGVLQRCTSFFGPACPAAPIPGRVAKKCQKNPPCLTAYRLHNPCQTPASPAFVGSIK